MQTLVCGAQFIFASSVADADDVCARVRACAHTHTYTFAGFSYRLEAYLGA